MKKLFLIITALFVSFNLYASDNLLKKQTEKEKQSKKKRYSIKCYYIDPLSKIDFNYLKNVLRGQSAA